MKTRHLPHIALVAVLTILLAACSLFERVTTSESGGWLDWDSTEGGWEAGNGARGGDLGGGDGLGGGPIEEIAEAPPPGDMVDGLGGGGDAAHEASVSPASALRAGSVDDNAEWDDYLLYRRRFAETDITVHDVDVVERHIIAVANEAGQPVLGAKVTVYNGDQEVAVMRTHADGQALFFPLASESADAQGYRVRVEKGDASAEFEFERDTREHAVTLDVRSATEPVQLDVLFLVDVTGSMSDEIRQLKDNMIVISEQIDALPSHPSVRFAMTVYRDVHDVFVSRTFDFTPDVQAFTDALRAVEANGGGDYPEHLSEGLYKAIHLPEWRVEETVSIIFLIADAPPQLEYDDGYDYAVELFEANRRGIKIFPIASSGLDDQGEYIFRQLAQGTAGKFLFLTYGAAGGPGDETTHHVDDYSIMSLDELVVRVVEEELAHLSSGQ
jgi:hypothetical protein